MKINKITCIVTMLIVVLVATVTINNAKVSAVNMSNIKTTLIDNDGLDIDVASIKSNEVLDVEEYIRQNINSDYATMKKFEPKDIIYTKNIMADGTLLGEDKKINSMYDETPEAFVMVNATGILLYDVDEDSNYYVGYVDTMHESTDTYVADHSFAYTNLNGEKISDAIYDYDTGIAYVPKRYQAEDKNGAGLLNVQVELLQIVNSQNPNTTFEVSVEKDENINGNFATSGKATVESYATKFGVEIALDQEARNAIDENYFKVTVNEAKTDKFEYYKDQGILVVNVLPNEVQKLNISISEENVEENLANSYGIATIATDQDMIPYSEIGQWTIDQIPYEGQVITIKGRDIVEDRYVADPYDSDRYIQEGWGLQNPLPIYNVASDSSWEDLVHIIYKGGTVDLNNLVKNDTMIQHVVTVKQETTVDGITIPHSTYYLKCVHNDRKVADFTYDTEHERIPVGPGVAFPYDASWEVRIRIFKVADDYLVAGLLTTALHTQAGAGIFKILYTGGNGNLEVGKQDQYGNWIGGARLAVSGPDGYYQEITTNAGAPTLLENVKKGTYTVTELNAPVNMIKNSNPTTAEVYSNTTSQAVVVDNYQRGSVQLIKYDAANRASPRGNTTLAGALFDLCAAENIYEGTTLKYNANQVIKTVETDINGQTQRITDLPIGRYYYVETKASTGYKKYTERIPVEITYQGQDASTASYETVECAETPMTSNLKIIKSLSATDYDPEIKLKGAQFKVTLKSAIGTPKEAENTYYTTISGDDGICEVNNVTFGVYVIEETLVPVESLKAQNQEINFDTDGKTYTVNLTDPSKEMKIRVIKKDAEKLPSDAEDYTLGDAVIRGAEYTIYRKNNNGVLSEPVDTIVVDKQDASGYLYAESKYIRTGTYYVKETKAPEGYNIDETIYTVVGDNRAQNQEHITVEQVSVDYVKRGKIEILKRLEESDYDPEINLKGAQFKITLKSAKGTPEESRYTFYTNKSEEDGICYAEELPYGTYEVEECVVPDEALKIDNFDVFVSEQGKTYKFTKVDVSKKMKIRIRKQDYDTDLYGKNHAGTYGWTQGDAKLRGAEYTIYRKYENGVLSDAIDTITIDHQDEDGYWCAESDYMWTGTYYVKETKRPEGYLIDENVYTFTKDNREQTVEHVLVKDSLENAGRSTDRVERGRVEVVKFDQNTDTDEKYPATGAKLWLVLNSSVPGGVEGKSSSEIAALSGLTYYEETINDSGYADFVDRIYKAKYPDAEHTIPYGTYTIIEVQGSDSGEHTHFFSKPQEVKVTRQGDNKYYILGEEQIRMYLQIQKTDVESNQDVELPGAVFKVWDVKRDAFVTQKYTPDGEDIQEFVTNSNGKVTLPEKLDAGEYIIYEIKAPEGYYATEDYRLPENASDVGLIGKGGKYVLIDKAAMGIEPDSTGEEVDLYYKAEIPNEDYKAKLQIVKTGEQFSGVTQTSVTYTNTYDVTKPKFENKGLQGVTYEIIAAKDITSPDGNYVYVTAGTKVDTITTDENGIAETEELHCGEYRIVETVTPKGYITDNNIPNVVLENKGPEKVKTTVKELSNVRQKLSVMIDKVFEDVKYSSSQEIKKEAIFGIYTNQDFTLSNGYLAMAKDTLVATIKVVDGVEQDTDSIDLPEGEYYVRELEASYPYTILDETKDVTLKYEGQEEKLIFKAGQFINIPETATVTLIKLSTSTLKDVVLNGNDIDKSKLDEEVQALLKELSGMSTEEVKAYLQEKQVKFVAGAKYGVYIDENCTEPLYMEDEYGQFVKAVMTTDDTGLITMGEVPLGTYYFKEIEAPNGYELSDTIVELELTLENKDAVVYQALVEEPVIGKFITKTDIFTGEVIPNCVFEVRDLKDNVLLHDKTDNKGVAYIPVDILKEGEKYYFVEIEAPEIYDLNPEPHEFTAHFDENGNWDVEPIEVENTRKKSEVTFEKSDFADSTPIPNCKFELRSLETDFVVEGVTDEEGKYVFKDIPYGKYTYRELEAPEEYIIDTEEHEIVIDTEKTTVKITNEKAPELPDTSDIAVYSLSVVALVSIFGILFVIKRNKKINN